MGGEHIWVKELIASCTNIGRVPMKRGSVELAEERVVELVDVGEVCVRRAIKVIDVGVFREFTIFARTASLHVVVGCWEGFVKEGDWLGRSEVWEVRN